MKRINVTLFENTSLMEERYYDLYKENCDNNELPVQSEDSDDFYRFACEMEDIEWDQFKGNIRHSQYDGPCVICGKVGLWTGVHDIIPERCENLWSAISKCIKNCDYIEIRQNCSKIEVTASHHDGTNEFEIYLLNDKGINTVNGNLSNRRYHRTINDYLI